MGLGLSPLIYYQSSAVNHHYQPTGSSLNVTNGDKLISFGDIDVFSTDNSIDCTA